MWPRDKTKESFYSTDDSKMGKMHIKSGILLSMFFLDHLLKNMHNSGNICTSDHKNLQGNIFIFFQ